MTAEQTAPMAAPKRGAAYQIVLVALLSLNFGIVFFDRNALNFLMPFVQPDLNLTNTHVGILASALSLTWAVAGLLISAASDKAANRKGFLLVAIVVFSLCSVLSGLATSFLLLLGARLLMGAAEGPINPISHALVVREVDPRHRGLAMGVMQNFGSNFFGSFVAPVLLVAIAAAWGWRSAFFLAGIPGIVTALLIWKFIDEPPAEEKSEGASDRLTLKEAFSYKNIVVCSIVSVMLVSYLVITWAFMPLYLTQVKGVDPGVMSWLMGTLGISATVGSFVVAGLSDRIGRKPVLVIIPFLGVILPLGAMFFDGSYWVLAVIFFFGWALNGCFPLFMATVPSETIQSPHIATVLALVMATGEVFGGVLSPFFAGMAADKFGLTAPLWIIFGFAIASGIVGLFLTETAPIKRAKAMEPTPGL
ncbi:MFS transporter [Marinicaulis aureus]|uniref:MFS transporter n=1 Tax=Hyphococcus aureus TaxID=2666033 RepID=A0ABW1KZQ9_9PROT